MMFYEIGVLEDFAEFTGKRLCWNHFLTKLQAYTHKYFSMNFVKFSRTPLLQTNSTDCFLGVSHKITFVIERVRGAI